MLPAPKSQAAEVRIRIKIYRVIQATILKRLRIARNLKHKHVSDETGIPPSRLCGREFGDWQNEKADIDKLLSYYNIERTALNTVADYVDYNIADKIIEVRKKSDYMILRDYVILQMLPFEVEKWIEDPNTLPYLQPLNCK